MAYGFEDEYDDGVQSRNEARRRRNSGLNAETSSAYNSVPENMDELDRLLRFLSSRNTIQEQCAVAKLSDVVRSHGAHALAALQLWLAEMTTGKHSSPQSAVLASVVQELQRLVSTTADELEDGPRNGTMGAARPVTQHRKQGAEAAAMMESMALHLSPFAIQVLCDNYYDDELVTSVLSIVERLVSQMDMAGAHRERFEGFLRKFSELALAKGGVSEPVFSRVTCSRLLGSVIGKQGLVYGSPPAATPDHATANEAFENNSVLEKMIELCQDTEYVVRIETCRQLPVVVKAVGNELALRMIVPEILELARDEDAKVRLEAVICSATVLAMVPGGKVTLDGDCRDGDSGKMMVQALLPAMRCFVETFSPRDSSTECRLCEVLPMLMRSVLALDGKDDSSLEEKQSLTSGFLDTYCKLRASSDACTRKMCASISFDIVETMQRSAGSQSPTLMSRRTSPEVSDVGRAAHGNFFDIADEYAALCDDDDVAVRCEAVKCLPDIVTLVNGKNQDPTTANYLLKLFLSVFTKSVEESGGGGGGDPKVRATSLHSGSQSGGASGVPHHMSSAGNAPEPSVLHSLLLILADCVLAFEPTLSEQKEKVASEVIPIILRAEKIMGMKWRYKVAVLDAIYTVVTRSTLFAPASIEDHFLPLVLSYLDQTNPEPLKQKCIEILPHFIRKISKRAIRAETEERLIQTYAKSPCCHRRLTFAQLALHLIRANSSFYFKRIFFDSTLALAYDPVPNVRLEICGLLPRLKMTIAMPHDVIIMDRLGNAMSSLMIDLDPYVAQASSEMATAYRSIQVRSSSATHPSVQPPAGGDKVAATSELSKFEEEDMKKLREEDEFLRDESGLHHAPEGYTRRTHDGGASSRAATGAHRARQFSEGSHPSSGLIGHNGNHHTAEHGNSIKSVREAAYASQSIRNVAGKLPRRRSLQTKSTTGTR